MGRRSSSALAKINSSARAVLPDPGAPMMMLIEFSGIPPSRISSSSRLPVERRPTRASASSDMLSSPDACGSCFEDLSHRVYQHVLGERLQEKCIGARLSRPPFSRQDAEDQDGDIAR